MTSRVFFVNKDGKKSTRAPTGVKVRMPTDMARLSNLSYHEKASTVEVVAVPVNQTIPTPVINALPSGPIEYFSSAIGFHYQPNMPKGPTVAMLLNIHTGKYKSFQLVMGGSAMTATVPFGKLLRWAWRRDQQEAPSQSSQSLSTQLTSSSQSTEQCRTSPPSRRCSGGAWPTLAWT